MAQTKIKLIADGVIDVNNLAAGHTITTDNIGEGSNLYYTDARVASYLATNNYTDGIGTTNYISKWSDADTLTDSIIQDNGTTVSVGGSLAVSGDVSIADKIVHTGDTDTSIRFLANNNVTIETAGVERVRVDPGGNFGVGTNNAKAVTGTFYPASGWQVQQFAGETDAALIVNGLNGVARIHLVANTASANQKSYIIQSDSGNLAFASLNDNLSGSEKLRILSSGGITFNGDTAAANALDDYEEGTWTPTLLSGTCTGTAYYTKIGRLVNVFGEITHATDGSGATGVTITNLPIAAGQRAVGYSSFTSGLLDAGDTQATVIARYANNSSSANILLFAGYPSTSGIDASRWLSGVVISFNIIYIA